MDSVGITFLDIMTQGTYGFLVFVLLLVLFILAILWVILPFAVFKIKNTLGDTNIQLMRVNNYLMSIEGRLKDLAQAHTPVAETDDPPPMQPRPDETSPVIGGIPDEDKAVEDVPAPKEETTDIPHNIKEDDQTP